MNITDTPMNITDTPKLSVIHGHVYASSLEVARHFERQHQHVLREIESILNLPQKALNQSISGRITTAQVSTLEQFNLLNFEEITRRDSRNREQSFYNMTRDGFTLLAMNFKGTRAAVWKVAYIRAFNEMESELRRQHARTGQFTQLSFFPQLQQTVSEQAARPTMTLTQAVGLIAYQGLNIPPVTRDQLARQMDRGVIEGCRENGRRVLYVDSFEAWLSHRRAA
jgi:Rha family phage regulatory protein